VPYSSLDVQQRNWGDKRASAIIHSVNEGLGKLNPERLVSGYKFKNMSMMSATGLKNVRGGRGR